MSVRKIVVFLHLQWLKQNNMKRITLLLTLVLCMTQTIVAQDIIVTRNSERIDCKVEKVEETAVEYKRTDNPDGPVFVIPTSKIASILYANGTVQVFEQTTTEPTTQQKPLRNPNIVLYRNGGKIWEKDGGEAENLCDLLGEADYMKYLNAYEQYTGGETAIIIGWLGALSGLTLVGVGVTDQNTTVMVCGYILAIAADITLPIGYIIRGVNAGRISRIAEGYNDRSSMLSMNMQVAPTLLMADGNVAAGLGVSLRF